MSPRSCAALFAESALTGTAQGITTVNNENCPKEEGTVWNEVARYRAGSGKDQEPWGYVRAGGREAVRTTTGVSALITSKDQGPREKRALVLQEFGAGQGRERTWKGILWPGERPEMQWGAGPRG